MKWVEAGEKQKEMLESAGWMQGTMLRLLDRQRKGGVLFGPESYLRPKEIGAVERLIAHSVWTPDVAGMKWVSSRPANVDEGRPRGQAVTVLNDPDTGLPLLVLDGTDISNARTAAFACLAITRLLLTTVESVGFVGAGRVHDWQALYTRQLWPKATLYVYDPRCDQEKKFADRHGAHPLGRPDQMWNNCQVVSFATAGASTGWVRADVPLDRVSVVINTSLRDLKPEMFSRFQLIVTDCEKIADAQGTPYNIARHTLHGVKATTELCHLGDLYSMPILVNPMGLVLWDVGVARRLFQDEWVLAGGPES